MFTGLVTAIGTVQDVRRNAGGLDLSVACSWVDLTAGESIAVDGACLTVTAVRPGAFECHVVLTTLERTRFAECQAGHRVNLERALRAGDRLGGHLVQGHVDGVGVVAAVRAEGDALLLDLDVPAGVAEVCIPLGSITVDGVSLTINALPGPRRVQVALIPFTLQHTTLGDRRSGDRVHLEGDTVAKYLRALAAPAADPGTGS